VSAELIAALRAIAADELAALSEHVGYGYAPRGIDPRDFTPNDESCSPAEIAEWRAACEAWERGERPRVPGPHDPPLGDAPTPDAVLAGDGGTLIHQTRAYWGVGSYVLRDERWQRVIDALAAVPA